MRSAKKELLDNLHLEGKDLNRILNQLATINRLFGSNANLISGIEGLIKQRSKVYHIVDLGCGGGDSLMAIAKWAEKKGITVELTGIDGNQHSIDYAISKNKDRYPINFQARDILADNFQLPECDILVSSHFIYHLSDREIFTFFNQAQRTVSTGVVINDLERNSISPILFWFFARLAFLHPTVRKDGMLAIRRSFKKNELESILQKTNVTNYRLKRVPIFRLLLTIPV